jgi:hypothetical protein
MLIKSLSLGIYIFRIVSLMYHFVLICFFRFSLWFALVVLVAIYSEEMYAEIEEKGIEMSKRQSQTWWLNQAWSEHLRECNNFRGCTKCHPSVLVKYHSRHASTNCQIMPSYRILQNFKHRNRRHVVFFKSRNKLTVWGQDGAHLSIVPDMSLQKLEMEENEISALCQQ